MGSLTKIGLWSLFVLQVHSVCSSCSWLLREETQYGLGGVSAVLGALPKLWPDHLEHCSYGRFIPPDSMHFAQLRLFD